jgi:hypothetical protein
MTDMNTLIHTVWARLALAVDHFFQRATPDASPGLEAYLSTAQTLHQLEDMQRRWDRAQRGLASHGAR